MKLVEIIGNQYVTIQEQDEKIRRLESQVTQLEAQVTQLTPVAVVDTEVKSPVSSPESGAATA